MHATPGGPTSRDPARESLESMLVSSFVCPCALAQGSPSQNPKTPDRDNRVQGCVPITSLTPPLTPVLPFFTPPLHALSLGSGSIARFGQVVRVAARAPANRQREKCRTMCHPLDVVGEHGQHASGGATKTCAATLPTPWLLRHGERPRLWLAVGSVFAPSSMIQHQLRAHGRALARPARRPRLSMSLRRLDSADQWQSLQLGSQGPARPCAVAFGWHWHAEPTMAPTLGSGRAFNPPRRTRSQSHHITGGVISSDACTMYLGTQR